MQFSVCTILHTLNDTCIKGCKDDSVKNYGNRVKLAGYNSMQQ